MNLHVHISQNPSELLVEESHLADKLFLIVYDEIKSIRLNRKTFLAHVYILGNDDYNIM